MELVLVASPGLFSAKSKHNCKDKKTAEGWSSHQGQYKAKMSDSTLPQKRLLEDDSKVSTRSTAPPTERPNKTIINKFKPFISYKSIDFTEFQPPSTDCSLEGFKVIDDIPYNTRRGFQYSACRPNPLLPLLKFGTTDLPPYKPSLSLFDRSSSTVISEDCQSVTTERGWVSARSTVPISEGKVYFEFNIVKSDDVSHVRIGIGRREASIEAPIGFDGYGYGLRDTNGQKIHLSRPTTFMDRGFKTGDVIGFLVELPKLQEFQDIVRDQIAIRYRHRVFFEKYDYVSTNNMEHLLNPVTVFGEKAVPDQHQWKPNFLPDSKVTIYKNGENAGIAFENLYSFLPPDSELKKGKGVNVLNNNGTLGYYPTISVFKGGIAEINAGPDFKFKPNDLDADVRGLHQVYDEKIAEDTVWDIIDEIEAESIEESIVSDL